MILNLGYFTHGALYKTDCPRPGFKGNIKVIHKFQDSYCIAPFNNVDVITMDILFNLWAVVMSVAV